MNILTIDTSTRIEIVSVKSGDKTADMTGLVNVSHSVTLFVNIEKAFSQLDININDINIIGVGIGPGSFTGIRIAVSTARMLAQITKAALIGIKTPHFFSSSADAQIDDNILVCFDAKRGRVFGALYRKGNSLLPDEIIEPGDYHIDFLIDKIDKSKKTHIIGDAGGKYYDSNIKNKIRNHVLLSDFIPSGITACGLTQYMFEKSPCLIPDYNLVLPFYSRKSDAEVLSKSGGIS